MFLSGYICPVQDLSHEHFMRIALKEAQRAYDMNEVPVGAVIVADGTIIARGYNLTERLNDPTAHAEMQAITSGAEYLGGKYLRNCTLYVTLEPCPMCAGALYWSQITRIVYGAKDDKRGYSLISDRLLHPKTEVIGGVLAEECGKLVTDFFKRLR